VDGEAGLLDDTLEADPLRLYASLTCWFGFIALDQVAE
jgi:hypothetical protein